MPLYHCLWQETDERDAIRTIVIAAIFETMDQQLAQMKDQLEEDIKQSRYQRAAGRVDKHKKHRDADKKAYNDFFYRLPQHDTGNTFVVMTDYQLLPAYGSTPEQGILYRDKRNPKATVIRTYADKMPVGARPVNLTRDDKNIYIDGVRYEVEQCGKNTSEQAPMAENAEQPRDYAAEIDRLADQLQQLQDGIKANMMVAQEDVSEMEIYLKDFYKELAFTRQDIMKLYA